MSLRMKATYVRDTKIELHTKKSSSVIMSHCQCCKCTAVNGVPPNYSPYQLTPLPAWIPDAKDNKPVDPQQDAQKPQEATERVVHHYHSRSDAPCGMGCMDGFFLAMLLFAD